MAIGDGVSAIASLAVTFGGFSPTAMDGVKASREQIERVEVEMEKKRAADDRKRELERARTSQIRTWCDQEGTTWRYVVIDEKVVRIEECESDGEIVKVPTTIDGLPVYAIAPDGCARIESAREIICADSIEQIGPCAFRMCTNLKRLVLPGNVCVFDDSWLRGCSNIEEIVLPEMLDKLTLKLNEQRDLEETAYRKKRASYRARNL